MTAKNLFTALSMLLLSFSALATPIPSAHIDGFDMIYSGEYFTSKDNLSGTGGDTDPLPFGGDSYSNFTNLFEVGYSIRPGIRFSGGGEFAYANSKAISDDRTNSEFTNLILSAQYYWGTDKLIIVPNFRATIAMNEIDPTEDAVLTSEGSSRYELGSWVRYPIWVLDNFLYVGYIYQEDEKADLLNWALGTKWKFSNFILKGQLNGVSTVVDDGQTDFLAGRRTDFNNLYSAGSLRFNSINPSYIEFETTLEYEMSPTMRFGGGLGHTITGKNYGYGLSILLSFTTEFRTDNQTVDSAYRLDGTGEFKPELENYEEKYFE